MLVPSASRVGSNYETRAQEVVHVGPIVTLGTARESLRRWRRSGRRARWSALALGLRLAAWGSYAHPVLSRWRLCWADRQVLACVLAGDAGPLAVGTQIEAVDRFMGRRIEFLEEIVAFDRPTQVTVRASGDVRGEFRLSLNEIGGATSIALAVDIEPSSLAQRALDPVLRFGAKRMAQADFQRLKARLEGGVGRAAA